MCFGTLRVTLQEVPSPPDYSTEHIRQYTNLHSGPQDIGAVWGITLTCISAASRTALVLPGMQVLSYRDETSTT